jgi:hypothetical protein
MQMLIARTIATAAVNLVWPKYQQQQYHNVSQQQRRRQNESDYTALHTKVGGWC